MSNHYANAIDVIIGMTFTHWMSRPAPPEQESE